MTVERPFVSVVVPVWNRERTIGGCLASVLRADYPADRREVVVVNNTSTDRTAEIIAQYPVRCVYEGQRGTSAARNRGIEASRGEVVALIDSDCIATKRWLTELATGFVDEETFAPSSSHRLGSLQAACLLGIRRRPLAPEALGAVGHRRGNCGSMESSWSLWGPEPERPFGMRGVEETKWSSTTPGMR